MLIAESEKPYHERKVTLLNGPHTVLSPVTYLSGVNIVRDACNHEILGKYINKVMFDELLETLNLPKDELKAYGESVLERFNNPYVDHQVTSIMLNSFPKFETRDLPGLKIYLERKGELPKGLVLGLAAIIEYYKGGTRADGAPIEPNDAQEIMDLLKQALGYRRYPQGGRRCTGRYRHHLEGVERGPQQDPGSDRPRRTVPQLDREHRYAQYRTGYACSR